jgi:hypothetical protein
MKKPIIKDGKIKCEVCGKWFKRLTKHIGSHGMRTDDYRGKFGYSFGTSLDAEPTKINSTSSNHYWGHKEQTPEERRFYQIQKEVDIFNEE